MAVALVEWSTDFWPETMYRFPGSEGSCDDEGRSVIAEGGSLDMRRMHKTERARARLPTSDRSRSQPLEDIAPSIPLSRPSLLFNFMEVQVLRRHDVSTSGERRVVGGHRRWEMGTGTAQMSDASTLEQHLRYGRGRRRKIGGAWFTGGGFFVSL